MSALDIPAGYAVRAPSLEDASTIADLLNESNLAEVGFPWTNAEQVRDELTSPGRDEGDVLLLVADDGSLAGYLSLWADAEPSTEIQQFAWVRPSLLGRGLSTWLLRAGEERARKKVDRAAHDGAVFLRVSRWVGNDAAGRLFASLGYTHARTFDTLRLELNDPIAVPKLPDGIAIRTFDRERDVRSVYQALAEAFADHWGGLSFPSFDDWNHEEIDGESSGFDAGLWFLATDGGEVVGAVCAFQSTVRDPTTGQVDFLGVRRPWRGRGVARALLLSALSELTNRRIPAVELGVDSESETGATRLYEGVGMRIAYSYEKWEKELRRRA